MVTSWEVPPFGRFLLLPSFENVFISHTFSKPTSIISLRSFLVSHISMKLRRFKIGEEDTELDVYTVFLAEKLLLYDVLKLKKKARLRTISAENS